MWHCNPSVLVSFVRVRGWLAGFCGECELSYTVCIHLFRVRRVKRILLALLGLTGCLALYLNRLALFCCWELVCWNRCLRKSCSILHVCFCLQSYWHLFGCDWVRLSYNRRFLWVFGVVSVILKIKLREFVRNFFCVFSHTVYILYKTIKVGLWPLVPRSVCQVNCIFRLILILLLWNQHSFLLNQSVWSHSVLLFAKLSYSHVFLGVIAMLTLTSLLNILKQLASLNFNLFFRALWICKISVGWRQKTIQVIVLSGRIRSTRAESLLVWHPAWLVRTN